MLLITQELTFSLTKQNGCSCDLRSAKYRIQHFSIVGAYLHHEMKYVREIVSYSKFSTYLFRNIFTAVKPHFVKSFTYDIYVCDEMTPDLF